ncbi:hypothetical protein BIV04_11475 [Frigoribacterium sp. MCBA15_019]|nr:hypothetical protein BIV04_11475 [Frigoribacterium sp. MCBA15_019]
MILPGEPVLTLRRVKDQLVAEVLSALSVEGVEVQFALATMIVEIHLLKCEKKRVGAQFACLE